MDFFEEAVAAVIDFAKNTLHEDLEKSAVEIIYSSRALEIQKAIAMDNTANARLYVISSDRFAGTINVELYTPAA